VILVNLTCGRNPWKMATAKDPTFASFMMDRKFLKTILPLSDELNDILGMIFELDPRKRITIDDLRYRIIHCSSFTQKDQRARASLQAYQQPLSPASSLSNEGSMVSDHSDNSAGSSDAEYASDSDVAVDVVGDESNLFSSFSQGAVPVNPCLPPHTVTSFDLYQYVPAVVPQYCPVVPVQSFMPMVVPQ